MFMLFFFKTFGVQTTNKIRLCTSCCFSDTSLVLHECTICLEQNRSCFSFVLFFYFAHKASGVLSERHHYHVLYTVYTSHSGNNWIKIQHWPKESFYILTSLHTNFRTNYCLSSGNSSYPLSKTICLSLLSHQYSDCTVWFFVFLYTSFISTMVCFAFLFELCCSLVCDDL